MKESHQQYYIKTPQNQKIFCQLFRPNTENTNKRGYIFLLHGYGSHGNRSIYKRLAEHFTDKQFNFVTIDFHGHGHSDGIRGLVVSPHQLIDDVFCAMSHIFTHNIPAPFYIIGHSMGGGVAILMAQLYVKLDIYCISLYIASQLQKLQDFQKLFCGVICLSPLIDLDTSRLLHYALAKPLSKAWPLAKVPKFLYNDAAHKCSRVNKISDVNTKSKDKLTYDDPVRYGTAESLLHLSEIIKTIIPNTHFPFLIFHDKTDKRVPYKGSESMYEKSSSNQKKLIKVQNGTHDILVNQYEFVLTHIDKWIIRI